MLEDQCEDILSIMTALTKGPPDYRDSVLMWAGYEWSLLLCQQAMVNELLKRGRVDRWYKKTFDLCFVDPGVYTLSLIHI